MAVYLIDYENVNTDGLNGISRLSAEDTVIIFYSENADRMTFGLHRRLNESKATIDIRKVDVGGSNALDFQLGTYLGYLIALNREEQYCIVSNDRGYNHVANFWGKQKVKVQVISEISSVKAEQARLEQQRAAQQRAEQQRAEQARQAQQKAEQAKTEPAKAEPTKPEAPKPEQPRAEAPKPQQAKAEEPKVEAEQLCLEAPKQEPVPAAQPEPAQPEPQEEPEPQEQTAPAPRAERSSRPRRKPAPKAEKPVPPALSEILPEPAEAALVEGFIEKYKTKQGLNNALVRKFGNTRGGELYQKLKPLIADKKGC